MTEFLMRVLSFLVMLGFLGILVFELGRVDITVVVGLTVALVAWDFFGPKKKS
ncbi:MAG: hypothetical protein WCZ72_02485 [Gemmobacter sp.]